MDNRINLYFFGDIGSYDEYCPAFVEAPKYIEGEGRYLQSFSTFLI